MQQKTLKITGVLSDPTRYSIYQYISRLHSDVTVQEIADRFKIHANVARLHLTKLEDVKMLVSETKKTGKGGRPSRFYQLSNEVITLQFPYRDYEKLAEIALETLTSLGDAGKVALVQVGEKFGHESAKAYINLVEKDIDDMSIEEKIKHIEAVSLQQGLNPEIEFDDEKNEVTFRVYNCTFKELLNKNPEICKMHHALLNGIFQFFFENMELELKDNLLEGEKLSCTYKTTISLATKEADGDAK